jgi:hypothetical protein
VALAGGDLNAGEEDSGAHLFFSWHHTRSFWPRSRAESEQSCGSFAGRKIIFAFEGGIG